MNTLNPTNEALLSERARALEKQCAVLAAEIDRQRLVADAAVGWRRGYYSDTELEAVIDTYEASAPK